MGVRRDVDLIPWDFESQDHLDRMYRQRLACGWRSDEVQKWKEMGAENKKTLYWVVLPDSREDREELLAQHVAKYPQESAPLRDTARTHLGVARVPDPARTFVPVGHIALNAQRDEDAHLARLIAEQHADGTDSPSPPPALAWIATLYVSWALQGAGLGGAAMRAVERLAMGDPLRARVAVLDTMVERFQMDPRIAERIYSAQGNPIPATPTERWYKKQGYVEFYTDKSGYLWTDPATGEKVPVAIVFLKKYLQ